MVLPTQLHPGALCEAACITMPTVTQILHRPQGCCRIECGRTRSSLGHTQSWLVSPKYGTAVSTNRSPELEPASDTPFQGFSMKLQSLEILNGFCLPPSEFFPWELHCSFLPLISVMATPTQSPNLRVSFETSFPEGPLNPKINYCNFC